MKGGGFSAPGDFVNFKSHVPLHKIPIGSKHWRYYDFGPKTVPPLICIPGISATADVFYKQIMALSTKGYRVISVDIPRTWNHQEWIQAFEKFLDVVDVRHVHLYGTALGGFLAQLFAQHRPRELNPWYFQTRIWNQIVSLQLCLGLQCWTPSFLLKRYVLTGMRGGPYEPFVADSVDFVVSQVETLSKDDLASRLSLSVDSASVGRLLLSDSFITIMDTNDFCSIPQQLREQVAERYPGARQAYLKSGGDFLFLSRPDEVNLHLQLHLRRIGVEAQPVIVPNLPNNDTGGSSGSKNDREEGDNDAANSPTPEKSDASGPIKLKEPLSGGLMSDSLENQILNSTQISHPEYNEKNTAVSNSESVSGFAYGSSSLLPTEFVH